MDFRATIDHVILKEKSCIVSKDTAELLGLKRGDTIRIAPLKINE